MKRTNPIFLKSLISGLLALALFAGTANAWWNDEWSIRKKVTLDTTDKGVALPDATGAVPALIRLHDCGRQDFAPLPH